MILGARILIDVANVNTFRYSQYLQFGEKQNESFYIQLLDTSRDTVSEGYKPSGRRYIPAAGAALSVTIDNIDDARKITKVAVNPFPNDLSIFRVDILAADNIRAGTANLNLSLVEGGLTFRGKVCNVLRISPHDNLPTNS